MMFLDNILLLGVKARATPILGKGGFIARSVACVCKLRALSVVAPLFQEYRTTFGMHHRVVSVKDVALLSL